MTKPRGEERDARRLLAECGVMAIEDLRRERDAALCERDAARSALAKAAADRDTARAQVARLAGVLGALLDDYLTYMQPTTYSDAAKAALKEVRT
jgi:hypothetical protein